MRKIKSVTFKSIPWLIALSLAALSIKVNAAIVLEQQFSLPVGMLFQDNPELTDNKRSLWLYYTVPTYTVSALDGKNTWYANGALRVERSSNRDIADNREDPSLQLGWKRELEKGSFGLIASYVSTSTRSKQFKQTGLVQEDGTDTTRAIVANWVRPLSERLDFDSSLGYEKNKFGLTKGGDSNTFTDSTKRYLNTGLTYKLSETVSPYARVGINDFRALTQIKFQNYLAGVIVNVSPKFNVDAGTGITHFSSSGNNEWIGGVKANYLGGRYTIGSSISRSVNTTDIGDTELQDQFSLNYSYELSEKSRWGAALALGQNKSLNANKTQQITAFYARDLSPSWQMNLVYDFRNIKSENQNAAHGNSAGITFTYNTPKF